MNFSKNLDKKSYILFTYALTGPKISSICPTAVLFSKNNSRLNFGTSFLVVALHIIYPLQVCENSPNSNSQFKLINNYVRKNY